MAAHNLNIRAGDPITFYGSGFLTIIIFFFLSSLARLEKQFVPYDLDIYFCWRGLGTYPRPLCIRILNEKTKKWKVPEIYKYA